MTQPKKFRVHTKYPSDREPGFHISNKSFRPDNTPLKPLGAQTPETCGSTLDRPPATPGVVYSLELQQVNLNGQQRANSLCFEKMEYWSDSRSEKNRVRTVESLVHQQNSEALPYPPACHPSYPGCFRGWARGCPGHAHPQAPRSSNPAPRTGYRRTRYLIRGRSTARHRTMINIASHLTSSFSESRRGTEVGRRQMRRSQLEGCPEGAWGKPSAAP